MKNELEKMELYNIEAEQIILGQIIQCNEYYNKVFEIIKGCDFYEPVHEYLYNYLSTQINAGEKVDVITIQNIFKTNPILKEIGGVNYLSTLLGLASGIPELKSYAKLILDFSIKRQAQNFIEKLTTVIYNSELASVDILNKIKTDIETLQDNTGYEHNEKTIYEIVQNRLPAIEKALKNKNSVKLKTGLVQFDKDHGGLANDELIIFGGRPSMGKSTIASQIALNVAFDKKNVVLFSEEMSNDINADRTIASLTEIEIKEFERGDITAEQLKYIKGKGETLKDLNLYIDDKTSITPAYMEKTLRRLHRKLKRIDFIAIDYLQFTKSDGNEKDIRHALSNITKKLKDIAKKYNCPVMCLSQLNRELEKRDERRPELFDLRDSGTIEEDADMVIFCFRAEYYASKKIASLDRYSKDDKERSDYNYYAEAFEQHKNKCELLVRKNRNGKCGVSTINYIEHLFRAY